MATDARSVVETYFNAWKNNDFAQMRSMLDDKLDFAGPIDRFDTADAYQQAIRGLSQMKTDIVVHKTFVDGSDAVTWYDLHTRVSATCRSGRVEPRRRRQDHDGARGI
jgi:transposase